MASVLASPKKALVDVPLKTVVQGLSNGQHVTLRSKLVSEHKIPYYCIAHYVADADGKVDLQKQASAGGFYEGVEPMGLIWAMKIAPEIERKYWRLDKSDVTTPFIVEITVFDTHIGCVEDTYNVRELASTEIERWYKSENVLRVPIQDQEFEGTLFIPSSGGPFPGIIDLCGFWKREIEYRASLLASYGYATLALKYHGDKVSVPDGLNLDHLEKAAKFLSCHGRVIEDSIGVVGLSTGGTVALFMAAYIPDIIKCAAIINGPTCVHTVDFYYKGRHWKAKEWDRRKASVVNNGFYTRRVFDRVSVSDIGSSLIEYHLSKADILFLTSDDDGCVRWEEHTPFVVELMQKGGKSNYEIFNYPGAGHLIEPPFSPFFFQTYIPDNQVMVWGGNTKDHARAQERSWKDLLQFFQRTLRRNVSSQPQSKL